MSDYLDSGGYPTDEALEKIAKWPLGDWDALMEFVRDLWRYADCGYWQQNGTLSPAWRKFGVMMHGKGCYRKGSSGNGQR